jgi:hypothetical protein
MTFSHDLIHHSTQKMIQAIPTLFTLLLCLLQPSYGSLRTPALSPQPIIIDTDILTDVDDVGALAIANILHTCGLADLRGVMISTHSRYGALATSVSL